MRVGVFTPLLAQLSLEDVLKKLKKLNIDTVELGTGNYPGDPHCKLSMLDEPGRAGRVQEEAGRSRLHHQRAELPRQPAASRLRARPARPGNEPQDHSAGRKAGRSGGGGFQRLPGRFAAAKWPNWVTCPWPPDYLEILKWQWDEVVAPYWIEQAKFAADHGVKIAIEMHPGFVVYSPETMLKLRAIAGPSIGCNYDPSHMFWQGIDPIAAIRVLGDAIFHVHAKDTQIYDAQPAAHGRAGHQALYGRAQPRVDLPHLRLRPRRGVVEGIRLHAAHVRLRLRALDRTRRQPALARGRIDESGGFPERNRHETAARGRLVDIKTLTA